MYGTKIRIRKMVLMKLIPKMFQKKHLRNLRIRIQQTLLPARTRPELHPIAASLEKLIVRPDLPKMEVEQTMLPDQPIQETDLLEIQTHQAQMKVLPVIMDLEMGLPVMVPPKEILRDPAPATTVPETQDPEAKHFLLPGKDTATNCRLFRLLHK